MPKSTPGSIARFAAVVVATNLLAAFATLVTVVSLYQSYTSTHIIDGRSASNLNVERETRKCCKCFDAYFGTQFYCPSFEGSFDIYTSGLVEVSNSNQNSLCTITEITKDSFLKPVARSYNGMNWEASPGDYSAVAIACGASGSCNVSLPLLPAGSRFQITTFKPPSYTVSDEVARFLEQATFGPTLNDISLFTSSSILQLSFANWIKTQQASVPLTSHREYYRRRVNSRFEYATPMAAVAHPCQAGARYRRFAFASKDLYKILTIQTVGSYTKLIVDGFVRTVVNGPVVAVSGGAVFADGKYRICGDRTPRPWIGGAVYLEDSLVRCIAVNFNRQGGNPTIQFVGGDPPQTVIKIATSDASVMLRAVDQQYYASVANAATAVQDLLVVSNLTDPICSKLSQPGNPLDLVLLHYDGNYWIHDPRHELLDNTLESPSPDGGGSVSKATANFGNPYFSTLCSNVAPSFLNGNNCILSSSADTCSVGSGFVTSSVALIPLNATTMRLLYTESGAGDVGTLFLYAIDGLRIDSDVTVAPPCQQNAKSRWIKVDCTNSIVDPSTQSLFGNLIATALKTNTNPNVLDVTMPMTFTCPTSEATQVGFTVADPTGQCWRNVHPDHLNVYDFTSWTRSHPGNALNYNPIKQVALDGLTTLSFPSWHGLERWQANKGRFRLVGRLGDMFNYYTIPPAYRTAAFNIGVGFNPVPPVVPNNQTAVSSIAPLVCGSPNEVANDAALGGSDYYGAFVTWAQYFSTTFDNELFKQRKYVWSSVALEASDQLRQRVAWALSQILVISPTGVRRGLTMTEIYVVYYDIFVRNAFGNYRDVLKEVSYSSLMADMLTFKGSKSTAYEFDTSGTVKYADENYAREIMQLFTIGLYRLLPNGNKVRDAQGQPIQVYSNEDIVEYARAWTGFKSQQLRGNIEIDSENRVDPMSIDETWRDRFPKMGLNRRYVGDGYPLCADLPDKHFLSKGATYTLLGRSPMPLRQRDPADWLKDPLVRRLKLQPNGSNSLFAKLCGATTPDACRFVNRVVLDDNTPCTATECIVDTVRTVEVADGIFYEYSRPPCVYQAFYGNAKLVASPSNFLNRVCADPRTEVATTACCPANGAPRTWNSTFWGERSTFATASRKCYAKLCTHTSRPACAGRTICAGNDRYWTNTGCTFRVKIDESGNAAILHLPSGVANTSIASFVGESTKTFFRVDWSNSSAVRGIIANCASVSGCMMTVDEMCMCPVSVSESQVFFDGDNPSKDDVLRRLTVGAFHPSSLSAEYTSQQSGDVTWYSRNGVLSSDSVFSVTDDAGVTQLRKNVKLTVTIVNSDISFRNPVHFMSLEDPEPRDAHYETEATLDHYFYHPNTAPFIATRLAQRFGISNPSPGYIARIADSFRTGLYRFSVGFSSVMFGSGRYGDLAATIACVLLDREARTVVLDADPAHGSLREPLLRVIGLMRSMQFKRYDDIPYVDFASNAGAAIGQMAHEIPTVFSYFLPGYKAPGVVAQSSLVAPEAQVASGPKLVNLVNGMLSLIKYGFDGCNGGLGTVTGRRSCSSLKIGDSLKTFGRLTYAPSSTSSEVIVNELATLLTAGRLSAESRQTVRKVVANETDPRLALIKAQSLIVTSPEFHSNTIVKKSGDIRPKPQVPPSPLNSYKAVVYVVLGGGVDSFNMLVPHSCSSTNEGGQTPREQYNAVRTTLAFTDDERTRIIDASGQPCEQFAIHPNLGVVERLYKSGDLAFFANAGVVNAPSRFSNFTRVTKTILFDHNSMRAEAQKIDPFDRASGTGILGRMCDKMKEKGFVALPLNVEDIAIATNGVPGNGVSPITVSSAGVRSFNPKPASETFDPTAPLLELNGKPRLQSSIFGETWSNGLVQALYDTAKIREDLSSVKLQQAWVGDGYVSKMKTVANLLLSNVQRGSDREVMYVELGGWDHHADLKVSLTSYFGELNKSLTYLADELIGQGLWDNVALVVASDFGRTLTVNSREGSDHGWGGNYFMMGGSVKGGQVYGQYPLDITETSPINYGRGRIAPTTSWDSIMNSVADWMGIEDDAGLDYCLPNRRRTGTKLFKKEEVFAV
ncbi:Protein of unknown function (DUF1501) [Fragilaria crotonensis]|nr:Protein of unknown function (DUF1501) [Fragilaria crotonensis]